MIPLTEIALYVQHHHTTLNVLQEETQARRDRPHEQATVTVRLHVHRQVTKTPIAAQSDRRLRNNRIEEAHLPTNTHAAGPTIRPPAAVQDRHRPATIGLRQVPVTQDHLQAAQDPAVHGLQEVPGHRVPVEDNPVT